MRTVRLSNVQLPEEPVRILNFSDMLYPQNRDEFDKLIPREVWAYLQREAKKLLARNKSDKSVSSDVRAHWQDIADGHVPFGYEVVDNSGND